MAKKKKVTKKKVVSRPKAADPKEEALHQVIDDLSDEEVDEVLDAGAATAPPKLVDDIQEGEEKMVKITIPCHLKIKRKTYRPGTHIVPAHMKATILEMVHKKRSSDMSMFVAKNQVIQRLIDRRLVVEQLSDIDLKKLAK